VTTDCAYETLEIGGEDGRRFSLVLPQRKGCYAAGVAAVARNDRNYHQVPHVGVLILDYLKGGGTLIDVGANIGLGAIPAAVYGSNVVAVELLAENCLCLHLAVLANRLSRIRVFQCAAGDGRRLAGSAGHEAWGHVVSAAEGAPAAMLPLDDIVSLANLAPGGARAAFVRPPVLIKIDTEGFELPVLQGARQTIAELDPVLIVECAMVEGRDAPADRQTQAVKLWLEENGYYLYLHRGKRLVPRRAADLQEGHVCDFFASRREYRPGERIGRFSVAPLTEAESLHWVAEQVSELLPEPQYRLHAVGVLAHWLSLGHDREALAPLATRLVADPDRDVAALASRRLAPLIG
jgi:FkbM family methyltransferase